MLDKLKKWNYNKSTIKKKFHKRNLKKFYKQKGDTKMKTLEEIREAKASGNYYAVSRRGKKYEAAYTTDYGGVMFFCIPCEEEIIGYEERGAQNGNA